MSGFVNQQWPNFHYSYVQAIPADNAVHKLNELGFGYFGLGDPANSDRTLTTVMVQADSANTASIFVGGGEGGAEVELAPGDDYEIAVAFLSRVSVRNADAAPQTLRVAIVAMTP